MYMIGIPSSKRGQHNSKIRRINSEPRYNNKMEIHSPKPNFCEKCGKMFRNTFKFLHHSMGEHVNTTPRDNLLRIQRLLDDKKKIVERKEGKKIKERKEEKDAQKLLRDITPMIIDEDTNNQRQLQEMIVEVDFDNNDDDQSKMIID